MIDELIKKYIKIKIEDTNNKEILIKFKEQLKEKDEEIKNYKISEKFMQDAIDDMCRQVDANCYDDFDDCLKELIDNKLKTNTHQVCEKIKKEFTHWCYINNPNLLSKQKCLEILDQVEKGEINVKN